MTTPPPPPLPTLDALRALVADAAHRAATLLATQGGESTSDGDDGIDYGGYGIAEVTADIARFVAQSGDDVHTGPAAAHLGIGVGEMRRLATAHRYGGRAAVATCLAPRHADPDVLAAAEHAVQPLRPSPTAPVERHHNHLTDAPARVQLRYGPDNRWHPYVERYDIWHPAGPPNTDPAAAYRTARTALRGPGVQPKPRRH
ncbi:hypothetical protein R6L23_26600 [Streptomyces sp. SR27]|uniref:hypothetical protein n=1 Tax=Streptomyces sp. SR27 TaxID=3076630 RepID=UPI00295AFE6E|nr:hypothetical protein [Streptomyces sp. SR27]MDV9191736.1 hypothetical protein [Streptomyces sp. SR27]